MPVSVSRVGGGNVVPGGTVSSADSNENDCEMCLPNSLRMLSRDMHVLKRGSGNLNFTQKMLTGKANRLGS